MDTNLDLKEWFLNKENEYSGPYSFLQVLKMLQNKEISKNNLIKRQSIKTWKPIDAVAEFSSESIKILSERKLPKVEQVLFKRQYNRTEYRCAVIVHDHKNVFKGLSLEIGEGGAGMVLREKNLNVGQKLFLHFQTGSGVVPFNAIAEVVSKSVAISDGSEGFKYGVRFTTLSQDVRKSISEYTNEKTI